MLEYFILLYLQFVSLVCFVHSVHIVLNVTPRLVPKGVYALAVLLFLI